MEQSSFKLSKNERRFLLSLAQNANQTDTDIARSMGMSKSAISVMRSRLEKEGLLAGATADLDFGRLGVSFHTLILFQWNASSDAKLTRKMEEDFTSTPSTIYFAVGSTPNSKYAAMLAFRSFEEYNDFLEEFKGKYGASFAGLETLFIQPKRILKQTTGDLAKMLLGGV